MTTTNPAFDLSQGPDSPDYIAFEDQLRFTAETINRLITDHHHYTDDCGDELRNNLELSLHLANSAIDGDLSPAMDDLLNPDHDLYIGNFISYASDGLMNYCKSRGFKEEED